MSTKRRKASGGPRKLYKKTKSGMLIPAVPRAPRHIPKMEDKFIDTANLPSGPLFLQNTKNYTTPISLNFVSAGTDRNNRIGREIHMKRLHHTAIVSTIASANVAIPVRFRCIIFIDKESVQPLSADLLQEVYKGVSPVFVDFNLRRNMTDPSRFKVLYSKESPTIQFRPSGNAGLPLEYTWDVNIPLKEVVNYASGSNVPLKNNLYCVFMSDQAIGAGTAQEPFFTNQSRVMFTDQ